MNNSQTIAEIIEHLAKNKGISISTLLSELEMNKNALFTMKNSGNLPRVENLVKIANYFGVPIDFLLGTGVFSNWNEIKESKDGIIYFLHQFSPSLETKLGLDLNNAEIFINVIDTMLEKVEIDEEKNITVYPKFFLNDASADKIAEDNRKNMEAYIKSNNNNGQQAINGNVTVNGTAAPSEKKDTLTEQFMQKFEQLDFDDKVDVMQYVKNKK